MKQKYIKKFLKSGKAVEQEFSNLFQNTEPSSVEEDINEHWDVLVKYKVDVKGLKKVRRNDSEVNENIHWVELLNVNGKHGWLYSNETDFYAFELKKYWIIVEKKKLQEFIASKVDKTYVTNPELYKLYRRVGRMDTITLVDSFDLIYISECLIKKKQ
jgi:hypothetical protein